MIKKLGLGISGLIVAGAAYYFMGCSEQITAEIKKQVNAELSNAATYGFVVEERQTKKKSEHFVLSFDDTAKITNFLNTQGIQIHARDIENLKGLKLGVDMTYLADAYSAVSLDIYPLTLPTALHAVMQEPEDKKILTQIDAVLKKKAILIHLDVNKLANGFKGYVKDIDETFTSEKNVHITLKDMTFKGDLKDQTPENVSQNVKEITLSLADELTVTLKALQSHYVKTGATAYDYKTDYSMEQMSLKTNEAFSVHADHLTISATSNVKNNLASGTVTSIIRTLTLEEKGQKTIIDAFVVNTDASNLDMTALAKLEKIDPDNEEEASKVLQQLISKGVTLNISDVSAKNILHKQQDLGGFTLSAHLDIDKSLNVQATNQNPLAALNAVDANVKVSLDKALFSLIAKQPQAMMALMLFQPKDEQGKKVYHLELKDGKFSANGVSVN